MPGHQRSFNAAVVKAHRISELVFGLTKGRYAVLCYNFVNDPDFAGDVALVRCALNNICVRSNREVFDSWLADNMEEEELQHHGGAHANNANSEDNPAVLVRLALAEHIHNVVPMPSNTHTHTHTHTHTPHTHTK